MIAHDRVAQTASFPRPTDIDACWKWMLPNDPSAPAAERIAAIKAAKRHLVTIDASGSSIFLVGDNAG